MANGSIYFYGRHQYLSITDYHIFQAKARYEREERKKEEAKLRGEDTWMLPSISNRLDQVLSTLLEVETNHNNAKEQEE